MADKDKNNNRRKVVKTIKINNGQLTYEIYLDGATGDWYRNGKKLTENQLKNYKYYDTNLKAFRQLGTPHFDFSGKVPTIEYFDNPVYTPYYDKLKNDAKTETLKKEGLNKKQKFKFGNKYITLRTKGNMNLATIPYNMLDSIAINTGRSNTNIKTNLGLIGKESTFGGYSIPLVNAYLKKHPELTQYSEYKDGVYNPVGLEIDPYGLVTNHSFFVNPYHDYLSSINKKFPYKFNNEEEYKQQILREQYAKDAYENNRLKEQTPHYNDNILADGFARYAADPKGYNPGQPSYVPMVNNIANEVWNEPQIQNWWNTEGKSYYEKGLSERHKQKRGGLIRRRLSNAGKLSE